MKLVLFFPFACVTSLSFGQLNLPNASPDQAFRQQIGFTEVQVKYSRPSARGRAIFGFAAATMTFDRSKYDVKFGSQSFYEKSW